MFDLEDAPTLERLLDRPLRLLLSPEQRIELSGRRVLITGAGGSVGAELARQVAATGPEVLSLVDQSEYALFRIDRTLRDRWPALPMHSVLCDITRGAAFRRLCREMQPEVIYHAAAYKHVAMVEGAACSAVATNALGAYTAAQAARACGARFVLISTDKASHPHSVMGASKRLAERLILSLETDSFCPTVVRFGNVLGSSGSLVELIQQRIERRQPIEITHPRASRFFMSVGEAAELVLLVDLIAGAPGVYWLDMGAPIDIVQLAHRCIAAAEAGGARPVAVRFTGLRPGEKLTEEFPTAEVVPFVTRPSLIYRLKPTDALTDPVQLVRRLRHAVATGDAAKALEAVMSAVPEFVPSERARCAATSGCLARAA